uniref:Uncharacterized protein n=1 Tax=Trichobilharzia regenti TaxID=157069 RepID=A0AA85JFV9_TRIRE|nr:unnamed protein product [Trichobilharzia regenti]
MFQIGRSTDDHIDFVISEPRLAVNHDRQNSNYNDDNSKKSKDSSSSSSKDNNRGNYESAVSRFACRIHIDREPPYTARLYAAGFDASNNIFLGERAIKWKCGNSMDGLTTNGVMMLRIPPAKIIDQTNQSADYDSNIRSQWREVSVCGSVYEMRSNRCIPTNLVNEDNVLTDMTIIDLCGVTLLWRSRSGLRYTACSEDLMKMINGLNQAHIQCPVLFRTLKLPLLPQSTNISQCEAMGFVNNSENLSSENNNSSTEHTDQINPDQIPHVYVSCGHVHGWHNWRAASDINNSRRTCPLCLQASSFIPLRMGIESAFYVDRSLATHCFNPCGHIASENTVRYWCGLRLLNRHNFELHARCPFCLTPIHSKPVKLLFQSDLSEDEFLELLKEQLYVRTLNMEKYETISRCEKINKSTKMIDSHQKSPSHISTEDNYDDEVHNNNDLPNNSHLSAAPLRPPPPLSRLHRSHSSSSDELLPSSEIIPSAPYQLPSDIYSSNELYQQAVGLNCTTITSNDNLSSDRVHHSNYGPDYANGYSLTTISN